MSERQRPGLLRSLLHSASAPAPGLLERSLGAVGALRGRDRRTSRGARRAAVRSPLSSGGFLGASAAGWISTSPSLLPRTWWMWAANIALSQTYGYATGVLAERAVRRAGRALGVEVRIRPDHLRRTRMLGAAALTGVSAYSWVRGTLRQGEISRLVGVPPKNLATAAVGTAAGIGMSLGALGGVRALTATTHLYKSLLRPYLPTQILDGAAIGLTAGTLAVVGERVVRGGLLEHAMEQAETANRLLSPDVRRPSSPLRSGSPESTQSWVSLGAPGRRIVAGGASREVIAETIGAAAMDPIRVYAGRSPNGSMEQTVQSVLDELDRTRAWERGTLVLFTGTGTGWLQEWSLSAIEFLTGGDCATASMQYSVYTSALSYLLDRRSPQEAGRMLFEGVRARVDALPPQARPRLFVAGESLGSYGGNAAFSSLEEMLERVDGAVWTGTPGFTPLWRQIEESARPGSPAVAPIIDEGAAIRVVTRVADLRTNYWGGAYAPWGETRVVYAQHPSDPVAWFTPSLLWEEPRWLRERAGFDVSPAIRWFPWTTFWQIASDMPLSISLPGGHGHSYHEEMVPIWSAVLGQDPAPGREAEHEEHLERIIRAIRANSAPGQKAKAGLNSSQ